MIEGRVQADEDDPQRCQGRTNQGQCTFKALTGQIYCDRHVTVALRKQKQAKARLYNLAAYQARLDELSEAPEVMGLREEIAILRMMLERRLNACKTEIDLFGSANAISDLVSKIEKVLTACHRIEAATGLLLDKPTALAMGNKLMDVIATHITDQDILDQIAVGIINVIVEQKPLPKAGQTSSL